MQRSLPTIAAAALALACTPSCGGHPPAPARSVVAPVATAPVAAAPVAAPPAAAPPPSTPESGVDLSAMDTSIKPGDDFYGYANGTWLKTAKIPEDRASTGVWLVVSKRIRKQLADVIQNAAKANPAAGSGERKIADYYAAYMNTAAIESHGLAPLKPELDAIAAIRSRRDLARVLGSRLRQDVDPINDTNFHTEHLFGLFVAQGLTDPSHNIAYLLQGGLAMPSRDYYLSSDKAMAGFRDAYKTYIAAILEQAGTPNAAAEAKRVFALELKIARAQESLVASQDPHGANNPWRMADFGHKAPGLDWTTYFKAAQLSGQTTIDVWQPKATTGLSKLVASAPLADWRALLRFHTLDEYAPLLPEAFAELSFQFHLHTLQGVPQQEERWKRAVTATSVALGDAVGQVYVARYFPPSSKQAVEQLVDNLVAAFRSRLDTLSWMAPATRAKAKQKLDTLKVFVGYPDHWRSYDALQVTPDDPLGNAMRVASFDYAYKLGEIGKPVDRGEWWMTPQTLNAVNLPLENALDFPAAILQPPFFDPKADPAHNYGAIGAVIGHEISHSFDNLGAQFDAQGRMQDWWTPADLAHFKAATSQLADQFSAYEALPGLHVNGSQTLGEDIADVAGLTVSYLAYQASLGGKPAPVIDGLTGDQRFFLSFGQIWQTKMRDAALRQRINTDVHAPPPFRVRTVRNLDAWYPAFDVVPGQKLYLPPDRRVRIW
ncbi:MAG TPA: M13 family metallopeptidase [Candidatus Limnocylindria bacterium]|nr:M13 family metallopeptidase [Candidatus Limnocylindria bacterium]